ncbi:MAG: T9SS type A sorting domain-containing protein [Flavobacteriales bacterium]|nr:MAG: T9SS type A sorting domain-containing protein [Flavobacteriales bacterium]
MRNLLLACVASVAQPLAAQHFNVRNDFGAHEQSEIGWSLERADTGFVVFQFASNGVSIKLRIGLTLFDTAGALLGERSFGNDSASYNNGWMNSSDRTLGGGYVFCGALDSAQAIHDVVWRFSAARDSLWTARIYTDSAWQSIGYAAHALNDGSILAVGEVVPPGQLSQFFLAKLDAAGNVLWSQEYGGAAHDRCRNIAVAADGSIYLGGETFGSPGPDRDDYVIKTDPQGNVLWSDARGSANDDGSAQVAATLDNGVVYATTYTEYMLGASEYTRHCIRRLDANGQLLWDRKYGPIRFINQLAGIKALPDSGFIACGTIMGLNYPHGTLLRIAANGDSIWQREYTHPSTDSLFIDWHELRDVIPADDGGFVACGVVFDGEQDLWVIRVDSFGCLVPGCQLWDNVAEMEEPFHVLLYPNPVNDRLFISFRAKAAPTGLFSILDNSGAVVRTFAPQSSAMEIDLDVRDLANGMYVLLYQDKDSAWSSRFIKQ